MEGEVWMCAPHLAGALWDTSHMQDLGMGGHYVCTTEAIVCWVVFREVWNIFGNKAEH